MMANFKSSVAFCMLMALIAVGNNIAGVVGVWDNGHATFYGDLRGKGTEGKYDGVSKV